MFSGVTQPPGEVELLRAKLREAEEQLAAYQARTDAAPAGRSRRDGQWWRPIFAAMLVTIGAVLAPLTVVATWAHDEIGDTERFVQTVEPLASDPAVQTALADRIAAEINKYIDVENITTEALTALSGQEFVPPRAATLLPSLAGPLSSAIENFVYARVEQVVQSETFEQAWVQAMRQAHDQMVAVLTGETSDAVDVTDGAVKIDIAAFVTTVKEVLIDEGFSFASRIPEVNASFTVFQADNLGTAQKFFGWLDTLATILPVVTLLVLIAAVMVARNRRKALLSVGLAVAASMVLLGLTLNVVRPVYLDAIPPEVLPSDAAAVIYDQFVLFIRTALRAVGIVFLAAALAAFWFAPSGAGAALRTGASSGLNRVRSRTGVDTGPVGRFVGTYRTFSKVTVVGIGALVYLALDHPNGGDAVVIIAITVVVLIVLEFLASPAPQDGAVAEDPAGA